MVRTTARLSAPATVLLAGALVLSACSDDTDARVGATGDSETSAAAPSPEADVSDADVAFAAGMIPHHRSAIEMAQLAEDRAADPRVRDLAARIEAAQGPEIETLSGWLEQWDADAPAGPDHGSTGPGGTEHGSGGMMSEEGMQALMNSTGPHFDRAFLSQMVAHHIDAVEMAQAVLTSGRDPDVLAMAESIRDGQSAEIAEMEQLLGELGG